MHKSDIRVTYTVKPNWGAIVTIDLTFYNITSLYICIYKVLWHLSYEKYLSSITSLWTYPINMSMLHCLCEINQTAFCIRILDEHSRNVPIWKVFIKYISNFHTQAKRICSGFNNRHSLWMQLVREEKSPPLILPVILNWWYSLWFRLLNDVLTIMWNIGIIFCFGVRLFCLVTLYFKKFCTNHWALM